MLPLYVTIDTASPALYTINPTIVAENLSLFLTYTAIFIPIWSMIITAIAMRTGFDLTRGRSTVAAVIGFLPYYLLLFYLPSLIFSFTLL